MIDIQRTVTDLSQTGDVVVCRAGGIQVDATVAHTQRAHSRNLTVGHRVSAATEFERTGTDRKAAISAVTTAVQSEGSRLHIQ